jgi:DNA-binding transcriptional LysR family regulator
MVHGNIRRLLRHGMLPQLAVFEAVARLGSVTRAAEALHLAQPTVSTQIRKLADALELQLFEQVGRKIHLTAAGQVLLEGCEELFGTFSRLEDNLAALRGLKAGRLRLACSTTGKYFAPRLLAHFVERHPGIEVSLQIHNRQGMIERLARNEDDLYIFSNPPSDQDLVMQPIMDNPMVVFARADHPLAQRRGIDFTEVANEPFLMREAGSGTRMVAWEAFDRHGLEPRVRMELSANEAVRQGILAGLGISILSRYTLGLDTENPNLAVLDVTGFPIMRRWQLVYPVGKQISPAARAFMDLVRLESTSLIQDHLGHEAPSRAP